MTFSDLLITLLEIIGVIAVLWCVFHEDRLVAFEEKIVAAFRRKRLHVVKNAESHSYNV